MTLWFEVSHSKFGGHRPCRVDMTDLIFYVILQDHVIEGLCDFVEGSSSLYILTLSSLVVRGIVVVAGA